MEYASAPWSASNLVSTIPSAKEALNMDGRCIESKDTTLSMLPFCCFGAPSLAFFVFRSASKRKSLVTLPQNIAMIHIIPFVLCRTYGTETQKHFYLISFPLLSAQTMAPSIHLPPVLHVTNVSLFPF